MASYLSSPSSLKTKRKDLDAVYDDFSDFSPSSPARKIRRLDAELPPAMEEEEVEMQPVFDQLVPERQAPAEEFAANEERAIVLYKPVSPPIVQSPSCFSVTLDSDILSSYKKQFLHPTESADIEERANDKNNGEHMAVIPWVPSQLIPPPEMEVQEEAGAGAMDIEGGENEGMASLEFGGGLMQPWQQQHCLTPQLPPNTSTPIVWYQ